MAKDTTPVIITREELQAVREKAAIIHKSLKARLDLVAKIDALLDRYPKPKVKKTAAAPAPAVEPEVPTAIEPEQHGDE